MLNTVFNCVMKFAELAADFVRQHDYHSHISNDANTIIDYDNHGIFWVGFPKPIL